ncbi:hypothetical protein C8R46DRAFT_80726 [Mycena filopes]|nr:hypothetical protein C8R46DRAFT_80726 [Mycena filopes]
MGGWGVYATTRKKGREEEERRRTRTRAEWSWGIRNVGLLQNRRRRRFGVLEKSGAAGDVVSRRRFGFGCAHDIWRRRQAAFRCLAPGFSWTMGVRRSPNKFTAAVRHRGTLGWEIRRSVLARGLRSAFGVLVALDRMDGCGWKSSQLVRRLGSWKLARGGTERKWEAGRGFGLVPRVICPFSSGMWEVFLRTRRTGWVSEEGGIELDWIEGGRRAPPSRRRRWRRREILGRSYLVTTVLCIV